MFPEIEQAIVHPQPVQCQSRYIITISASRSDVRGYGEAGRKGPARAFLPLPGQTVIPREKPGVFLQESVA